jgi:hypothetical protein
MDTELQRLGHAGCHLLFYRYGEFSVCRAGTRVAYWRGFDGDKSVVGSDKIVTDADCIGMVFPVYNHRFPISTNGLLNGFIRERDVPVCRLHLRRQPLRIACLITRSSCGEKGRSCQGLRGENAEQLHQPGKRPEGPFPARLCCARRRKRRSPRYSRTQAIKLLRFARM